MARPLRIEFAGGLYHITARGNRREDIFFQEADRLTWLALLGEVCQRFNWVCHAYCQMSNHYHIVLEIAEANLSQGMRQLNGVYTQYINRAHSRVGHVFQGRYKAILVEKDSHLLELARYVVLNPVRAGMVKEAKDWPWSSYRAMTGKTIAPVWLMTDWLLNQFGNDRGVAVLAYANFVHAGNGSSSIWGELRQQIFLGSDSFIEMTQKQSAMSNHFTEIPKLQRRPPSKPLSHYSEFFSDRREAMNAAYQTGDYSLKAIADHFGVHYATVSRAVKKLMR